MKIRETIIYDMLINGFREGLGGIIMSLTMWFIAILIAFFLLWGATYVFDNLGAPERYDYGNITYKDFTPAHTTTTYMQSGKMMIPIVNHIPDNWTVTIEINRKSDVISVTQPYYDTVSIGDEVYVRYKAGNITGKVYVKEILQATP